MTEGSKAGFPFSPEVEAARASVVEFARGFPFFKLMGIELLEIVPGRARMSMAYREDLCQPAGIMHGGAIASLVDTCIAHAILLTPQYLEVGGKGGRMVSVDLRIKYFRPVPSGVVFCESTLPRVGRQIVHAESIVRDEHRKEVARGDSIYMILPARGER